MLRNCVTRNSRARFWRHTLAHHTAQRSVCGRISLISECIILVFCAKSQVQLPSRAAMQVNWQHFTIIRISNAQRAHFWRQKPKTRAPHARRAQHALSFDRTQLNGPAALAAFVARRAGWPARMSLRLRRANQAIYITRYHSSSVLRNTLHDTTYSQVGHTATASEHSPESTTSASHRYADMFRPGVCSCWLRNRTQWSLRTVRRRPSDTRLSTA